MNPRYLVLAVMYILELQAELRAREDCTLRKHLDEKAKMKERIAELKARNTELRNTVAELEQYKRWCHDPQKIKNMFNFWVESGVLPEYYG